MSRQPRQLDLFAPTTRRGAYVLTAPILGSPASAAADAEGGSGAFASHPSLTERMHDVTQHGC